MLSELVYASTSSEGHMMCMDQNLTAFADCLGTCERLVKTPIPLSYTRYALRHTNRDQGHACQALRSVPGR